MGGETFPWTALNNPTLEDVRDAKAYLSLPASRPLALRVGGKPRFYIYCPICESRHELSWREYRLLKYYDTPGSSLEIACQNAEMSVERAKRFFKSEKFKKYAACLQETSAIADQWKAPDRWYAMGGKWLESGQEASDTAKLVWKEFGDRVAPKPSRNGEMGANSKITINISADDWKEAKAHKESVEAEVVA